MDHTHSKLGNCFKPIYDFFLTKGSNYKIQAPTYEIVSLNLVFLILFFGLVIKRAFIYSIAKVQF